MARKQTPGERWSVNRAAVEFAVHPGTLARRLAAAEIKPDAAGTWSTRDICAAVFGDLAGEKLRKLRAEADLAEMERDEKERSLLPADIVEAVWSDTLASLRSIVNTADIPKVTKAQLIKQLHDVKDTAYTEKPKDEEDEENADEL